MGIHNPLAMRCATHPGVETELRCASCGKPICPDCLVEGPVGMKCRDCGRPPLPPKYQVSRLGYAAAVPAGLVLSAIAGALVPRIPFFLLAFLIAPVCGGMIGEAMAYASGRKRGPRLAVAAAVTVALGSLAGAVLYPFLRFGLPLARGGEPFYATGLEMLLLYGVIFSALSAIAAFWRIR